MAARPNRPMCLALLRYVRPIAEVDAKRPEHLAWIEARIAAGEMALAGRRRDDAGGVLLLRGEADAVEALVRADPYVTSGVAEVSVVAFTATIADDAIAALL